MAIDITPVSFSGSSTALQDIYNNGGASTISFQFTDSNFQTVSQITNYSGSGEAATASGAISPASAARSVPEPSSAMLLGIGLLAIGCKTQKPRRSHFSA